MAALAGALLTYIGVGSQSYELALAGAAFTLVSTTLGVVLDLL